MKVICIGDMGHGGKDQKKVSKLRTFLRQFSVETKFVQIGVFFLMQQYSSFFLW